MSDFDDFDDALASPSKPQMLAGLLTARYSGVQPSPYQRALASALRERIAANSSTATLSDNPDKQTPMLGPTNASMRGERSQAAFDDPSPVVVAPPVNGAVMFIGGLDDSRYKNVNNESLKQYRSAHPFQNVRYYAWDERPRIEREILGLPADRSVTLIGHSYGGDTGAKVVTDLPGRVRQLVTADPVSDFGIGSIFDSRGYDAVERSTPDWADINSTGGPRDNGSNIVAGVGGDWGDGPSGTASEYLTSPNTTHADFWDMLQSVWPRALVKGE
jgi:hypothetical protein